MGNFEYGNTIFVTIKTHCSNVAPYCLQVRFCHAIWDGSCNLSFCYQPTVKRTENQSIVGIFNCNFKYCCRIEVSAELSQVLQFHNIPCHRFGHKVLQLLDHPIHLYLLIIRITRLIIRITITFFFDSEEMNPNRVWKMAEHYFESSPSQL